MESLKTITVLFRAYNSLEKIIRKDISQYGLNVNEFGVLEVLFHRDTLTVKEVIDKVLAPNSSISYTIESLVRKSLIEKVQSIEDRRVFYLRLSKKGKDLMNKIFPIHKNNMRQILDVLAENEELILQRALVKIGKTSLEGIEKNEI
ncbi:MAG: MarR family transcriptional regulator [Candidatus Izemoplasmatales bacterium]|jgi:MarR family 2-MHQ and catechol resistance regulon transcriptional repressor|nr:MarR family transcriptional regulator [Candidatus Izemoplasmatales bacterium]